MKRLQCVRLFAYICLFTTVIGTVDSFNKIAFAQNTPPRWIVNCNNRQDAAKLSCSMSQTILAAKTRQRIISTTIRKVGESRIVLFTLPHGLDLRTGVEFKLDEGKVQTIPIQAADNNGAYARLELTEQLIDKFKSGNKVLLKMKGANGRNINLELSLAGFSKSYALLP